jgi:hypothetical protein
VLMSVEAFRTDVTIVHDDIGSIVDIAVDWIAGMLLSSIYCNYVPLPVLFMSCPSVHP